MGAPDGTRRNQAVAPSPPTRIRARPHPAAARDHVAVVVFGRVARAAIRVAGLATPPAPAHLVWLGTARCSESCVFAASATCSASPSVAPSATQTPSSNPAKTTSPPTKETNRL